MENYTINDFTEALASKSPTPGGGGASAMVSAIGIALGSMVGQYTIGKKKYAENEEIIKSAMEQAENLRKELMNCIEEDARAFEPLSKAYGLGKDEPGRDEILEKCLRDAAAIPLKILKLACSAVELQKDFADYGSTMMTSDAVTGFVLLEGAMKGAAINVKVNTRLMKDRTYAESINKEVDGLLCIYITEAHAAFDMYYGRD
ncbi:MAG: cyclodeaminase/cyclohydrolase family protein [Pseudobutyrivibrio sp.]|nr:cyclodeaminase/cyclohydrolase family protein [Pseudobutyrivibrio sp.]